MSVDVNKPVENPELRALLAALYRAPEPERPALREKIAEELALNAHLLAVIQVDESGLEQTGEQTAAFKRGTSLSFGTLRGPDGKDYLAVYTDWEEIGKNEALKNEHVRTLIVTFDDLAAITAGRSGVVVNPFGDRFTITPENVIHMKRHKDAVTRGCEEITVEKETQVLLGEPKEWPGEMVEAIRRYAETDRAIEAIWLRLMVRDGEQSYLLIVDHSGDRRAVFSAIAAAATAQIRNGMPVDMVPYADDFGRSAAAGEPIYRRRRGLFGRFRR